MTRAEIREELFKGIKLYSDWYNTDPIENREENNRAWNAYHIWSQTHGSSSVIVQQAKLCSNRISRAAIDVDYDRKTIESSETV